MNGMNEQKRRRFGGGIGNLWWKPMQVFTKKQHNVLCAIPFYWIGIFIVRLKIVRILCISSSDGA